MTSPKFHLLILLLFHVTLISSSNSNSNSGPQINITKHIFFSDFRPHNDDITLLGSAAVSPEAPCIHIPDHDRAAAAGRALYSSPIRILDPSTLTPASFRSTFSFRIGSSGGLSFIIVPDEFTVGRPGPWLGMMNDACQDEYKIVAIEFDPKKNPEFGDPNDNHVGINLGSIVSSRTVDARDVGIDLNDGSSHRAWINYDGNAKFLQIFLGPDGAGPLIPSKPVYSGNLDLSPYLNEYMFVGFSGSTGDNHTQIHSICSWNFSSSTQAFLRVPSSETCAGKIIVDSGNYQSIPNKAPSSFFIFIAVVALVIIIMLNLYFSSNRNRRHDSDEITAVTQEKATLSLTPPTRARKFNLAEISSATRGFGELQVLGSDARSVTYRGTLFNGCNVAVKRFLSSGENGVGRRRMMKEVKAIGKIRHPNLVPIRGWCFDRQEIIVVYDFVPNGSLDKWLFGFGVLPWLRRFKVVKDVAEALSYLHSRDLAHKNVKPSSVFLDISFRAIVGDFGFVMPSAESTRFESVVSQTADVFEFGVLLLEVVCGRRQMLESAWGVHEAGGDKGKLVDPRMGAVVNPEQAIRVVEVGLLCTLNDNKGRPTMAEVVEYLNGERPLPELPSARPVSLFPYSSTTALCSGYSCS